jgi:N-acetylmuramate 1-kinase
MPRVQFAVPPIGIDLAVLDRDCSRIEIGDLVSSGLDRMTSITEFPLNEACALVRSRFEQANSVVGTAMKGGASTRRFARFRLDSGKSLVAIYVPDATRSDEIDKGHAPTERWPFLEIRDLLAGHGILVPEILAEACDQGLLLVEDLGDLTLAAALEEYPNERTRLYQRAVLDLARAQLALAELPKESVVAKRAFDFELLRWEIDHFREWAIEARGVCLSAEERRVFDTAGNSLAATIASWRRGFVHRDYQSRNLMVRGDPAGRFSITWIDFQDALLGPRVYDLVALLGDSYQTFDAAFIEERLAEYALTMGLGATECQQLRHEFDLVTVQRKLKDAGRFVFIDRVKHDPSFLGFVAPTIDKVMQALARLRGNPDLRALEQLLRRRMG